MNLLIERILAKRPWIVCLHNVNERMLTQIRKSDVAKSYFVPKRPDLNPVGNLILSRHKLRAISTDRFERRQRNVDRPSNMTTGTVYVNSSDKKQKHAFPVVVSVVTLSAAREAWRLRQQQWEQVLDTCKREAYVLLSLCSNCEERGKDMLDIPDDWLVIEDTNNHDVQLLFRSENVSEAAHVAYFETDTAHMGLEAEVLNDTTQFYDDDNVNNSDDDDYDDDREPHQSQPRHSRNRDMSARPTSPYDEDYYSDDEDGGYSIEGGSSEEDEYDMDAADERAPEGARRRFRHADNYNSGRNLNVHEERDGGNHASQRDYWRHGRQDFEFDAKDNRRRQPARRRRDIMDAREIKHKLRLRSNVDRDLRQRYSRRDQVNAQHMDRRELSSRVFGKRHDTVGADRKRPSLEEAYQNTQQQRRAIDSEWERKHGQPRRDIDRMRNLSNKQLVRDVIFRGDNNGDADEGTYTRRSVDNDRRRLLAEREKQENEFERNLDDYYGRRRPVQSRPSRSSRQRRPIQQQRGRFR